MAQTQTDQSTSMKSKGRGWHGDPEGHASAGRKGGTKVSRDRSHMAEIGRKGGKITQARGTGHRFTSATARAAGKKSQALKARTVKKTDAQASKGKTRPGK